MKYILSLDAGGVKGIASAQFLYRLNHFLKKQLNMTIYDKFDMFIGSSIGGLIALGIGSDTNFDTFHEIFSLKNVRTILGKTNYTSYFKFTFKPKCGDLGITHIINKYLPDIQLNELNKKVLIVSYNLDEHKTVIYKENDINIRTLAKLTTAAPAYFPCVQCPDGKWHIDGGVSISNPALTAYIEGKELYKDEEIKILSVGTGYTNVKINGNDAQQWGIIGWIFNSLLYMLISTPFRIISEQCSRLLKDNFLRIDSETEYIHMDDTSKESFDKLKKLGDIWFEDNLHKIYSFFDIPIKSKI